MSVNKVIIALFTVLFGTPAAFTHQAFADNQFNNDSLHNPTSPTSEERAQRYRLKQLQESDLKERIMEQVPYAEDALETWKFVDGKTDVYFTNLRVDRKNKGLVYKTNSLPIIGEVKNTEFKFQAGKDIGLSFETSHIPLVGELEGFKFKGTVGDNSRVSFQYTVPLDWK